MTTAPDPHSRASESVATSFTRAMNASTSSIGVLADITVAASLAALPFVLLVRQVASGDHTSPLVVFFVVLVVGPPSLAIWATLRLRHARDEVVRWLAAQPFDIENLNALLAGLGDTFVVRFRGGPAGPSLPGRARLQPALDEVSEDALYLGDDPEGSEVQLKIGVAESKRLPYRSSFLRYERFRQIIERVLVPLHREYPISSVRVE